MASLAASAQFCSLGADEETSAGQKSARQTATGQKQNRGKISLGSPESESNKSDESTARAIRQAASALAKRVMAAGNNSQEVWDTALSAPGASALLVSETVILLHAKKQFELAVQGLESAIRNDLFQPWIYDVLAFEMKLAGRPSSDISRVLESRIDFATADVSQLLITAALMSRFEAFDEAIASCREASKLNPDSEDVWLMARSVADKSGMVDARVWSRCGILRHVWGSDHELQHEEARAVLTLIAQQLDQAGKSPEAEGVRNQLADANAIDLRVNLTWIGPSDLDLIITEPNGQECSYRNRATRNGGRLVREAGVGDEKNTSAKHTEQYVCRVAPNGEYKLAVRFVLGKAVGGTAVLEVIQHAGTPQEAKSVSTVRLEEKDVILKTVLLNGRAK